MATDIELIQSIASGDKKAFEAFYKAYSAKVYNTAISYTKDNEEAEEVTQDVFIKVFKSANKFRSEASVSTWIYRITVNTALNSIKKKKRLPTISSDLHPNQSVDFKHPGAIIENKEKATALYKSLDCLPDTQKTAFILSYIEELPRQEVAHIMETSLKAVESLLQRAKKNLRKELENMNPNRRKTQKYRS